MSHLQWHTLLGNQKQPPTISLSSCIVASVSAIAPCAPMCGLPRYCRTPETVMLSVWVQEAHVQYVCAICGKGDATPLELSTAAGRGSQEWGVGERGAQGLWQRMGLVG
jgi:hypothetical protein